MIISTAQVFSILDRLGGGRVYRVTLGDGRVSSVAAMSLTDCGERVREINSRAVILGIEEGAHTCT